MCELDETPDLRLRHYHRQHKRTLSKLLDTIKLGEGPDTAAVLGLIRSGASEEDIEEHIDRNFAYRPALAESDSVGELSSDPNLPVAHYLRTLSPSFLPAHGDRSIWQSAGIEGSQPAAHIRSGGSTTRAHLRGGKARQLSRSQSPTQNPDAHDPKHNHQAARATPNFGNLPLSKSLLTNNFPEYIQTRQMQAFNGRIEDCLPLNLDTESRSDRLSSAMLAFRDAARSMIARGQPAEEVLSMQGLDLELLFRDRRPGDPHTISTWACEFSKTWTFLPLHVRLSSVHYAGTFMRWLIMPCHDTYALLSKLMRPLDAQLFVPHTGDVDLCHLPCVRATQLENGGKWVNRITADSQRCNWVDGEDASIEERVVQTVKGPVLMKMLTAAFIEFIDDTRNWSLSKSVLKEFPELRGNITFHEDEQDLNP